MKVELEISKMSSVVSMSACPREYEVRCGIAYRAY